MERDGKGFFKGPRDCSNPDFRSTSAQQLLPATSRRRWDPRDDTTSGVVSMGYDPVTGQERCRVRVHGGIEDDSHRLVNNMKSDEDLELQK